MLAVPFAMVRARKGTNRMGFLTLGEAVDRVLARLADQREGKGPGGMTPPGKCARAEGEDYPARLVHGVTVAKPANTERARARRAARK